MTFRRLLLLSFFAVSGCNWNLLLDTTGPEVALGAGQQSFNPYGGQSSARRLALQQFKGCAINPAGDPIGPGTAPIPYPTECPNLLDNRPPYTIKPVAYGPVTPTATFPILSKTKYFLNQITLMDTTADTPMDPLTGQPDPVAINQTYNDLAGPLKWMTQQSQFSGLDWTGVSLASDRWETFGFGVWNRVVTYTNAAWMTETGDKLQVEILDAAGVVRGTTVYDRSEFLAENETAGHTVVTFRTEWVSPPATVGDTNLNPSLFGNPPTFRTTVKIEWFGSVNPFKQIEVGDLPPGDGAFRVTWQHSDGSDKLPPMYFPVQFVKPENVPATCHVADGGTGLVPCGPGLDPEVVFSTPANGSFYNAGDTFLYQLQAKDGLGNLLHPPESFPSFNDFISGQSNGLVYYREARDFDYQEHDQESTLKIIGPINKAVSFNDITGEPPYTEIPDHADGQVNNDFAMPPVSENPMYIGLRDVQWSTTHQVTLPPTAEPGTYALLWKMQRAFYGERFAKGKAFLFQVGQAEKTSFPNNVGNCQICHRGSLSLDNLRHGFSVNEIEGCKGCHKTTFRNIAVQIHQIHMNSPKFPFPKTECVVCHLTRKTVVRPSYEVCSSCHPAPHGTEFNQLAFTQWGTPSRYGECAQACHVNTPPTAHILPVN